MLKIRTHCHVNMWKLWQCFCELLTAALENPANMLDSLLLCCELFASRSADVNLQKNKSAIGKSDLAFDLEYFAVCMQVSSGNLHSFTHNSYSDKSKSRIDWFAQKMKIENSSNLLEDYARKLVTWTKAIASVCSAPIPDEWWACGESRNWVQPISAYRCCSAQACKY